MVNKVYFIVAGIILLFVQPAVSQQPVSFTDLTEKLYDMKALAIPQRAGERAGNFSSFDRRSMYDAATNTYTAWDANDDGSGYIRKEGNDIIVFEKEGPGVIWRVWSALAKE